MKMKAIALALFVAGASASYALAGDGHGKGSDAASTTTQSTSSTTTEEHGHGKGHFGSCREHVSYVFDGTFVSAAADGTSFQMQVTHGNHHARALGNPATVGVDAKTRFRKQGQSATLADLKAGDRVNVQARCTAQPAAAGAAPAQVSVVARRVVVKPAKGSGDGGDETGTTTTAATTTTG